MRWDFIYVRVLADLYIGCSIENECAHSSFNDNYRGSSVNNTSGSLGPRIFGINLSVKATLSVSDNQCLHVHKMPSREDVDHTFSGSVLKSPRSSSRRYGNSSCGELLKCLLTISAMALMSSVHGLCLPPGAG